MKLSEILPLFEARRNPHLNPKISAYEQLKQYKDDDNIFIHFSDHNKFGIYNVSEYDTPLGIYGYPLKYIWEKYNIDKNQSFLQLPFASGRNYIHVFSWNNNGTYKDVSDYYENDLNEDIRKLKKIYSHPKNINDKEKILRTIKILLTDIVEKYSPEDLKYNNLNKIDDLNVNTQNISFNNFKFGMDLEHIKDVNYHQKIINLKAALKQFNSYKLHNNYTFDQIIREAKKYAKPQTYAAQFWNICRYFANYGDDPNKQLHQYHMNMGKSITNKDLPKNWNIILRKLGYAGFSDNQGTGLIHPNEPIQMFLLGKDFSNYHGVILNQDFKQFKFDNYEDAKEYLNARYNQNPNFLSDSDAGYISNIPESDKQHKLFIDIANNYPNTKKIHNMILNFQQGKY